MGQMRRPRAKVALVALTVLVVVAVTAGVSSDPKLATPSSTPVFSDNFDGTTLASHWTRYDSAGNGGHGLRRPWAISLDGKGHLVVTASMSSGKLVSGGMNAQLVQTYGRYEVRVKTEPDPTGTMSGVVLTWPANGNWPVAGENNIYETGAATGSRPTFHSYVHYGRTNRQHSFTHYADATQWHTLTMDWRRNAIRIYRDGALVWTVTDRRAIPDNPHFLAIQLDATRLRRLTRPVRMYVDYVRIWR
jgi:hypothetical protein